MLSIAFVLAQVADPAAQIRYQAPFDARQGGSDVVVTARVSVNMSPHLLATSARVTEHGTYLKYTIVHNSDWLTRGQHDITVTWRLRGKTLSSKNQYLVSGQVLYLDSDAIRDLRPQWGGLLKR